MATKLLALETSDLLGSVAVLQDGLVFAERSLATGRRTIESLAPSIETVLAEAGWLPQDVDAVAVTVGPGSFTGLRIGVTTAKLFAFAVDAVLVGVQTPLVLAAAAEDALRQVQGPSGKDHPAQPDTAQPDTAQLHAIEPDAVGSRAAGATITVVIDAQRQQLYCARVRRSAASSESLGRWEWVQPVTIQDIDQWLVSLQQGEILTGPVLEKLANRLPSTVEVVDRRWWSPQARHLGQVALALWQAGQTDDPVQLVPRYYRRSAAEDKWDALQAEQNAG